MNIVDRVRELCEEKEITLTKLEIELEIGRGIISRWAKSSPNSDNLQKIADYFRVSVDYLLGRTEYRNAHLITEFVDGDKIEIEMDDAYFNKLSPGEVRQFLKSLRDAGFDLDKLIK